MVYGTPNLLDKRKFIYFSTFFFLFHQMTPLHLAAEGAHIKIVEYLVDQNANINIQDDNGVNTLDHAYISFYVQQWLIVHYCD